MWYNLSGENMNKILIIEDDLDISNLIANILKNDNYHYKQAFSGTEGLMLINEGFDLVILDLMIPGKTGEEVISEIREKTNIPVLILTSITDQDKKLELFLKGANDYITKPFNNDELLARVKVHLKNNVTNKDSIKYLDIIMDLNNYEVKVSDELVQLTLNEFNILKLLVENPSRVFTKNNLYELVWKDTYQYDENTINVHISKLRSKLKQANDTDYIETIWGIGYRIKQN